MEHDFWLSGYGPRSKKGSVEDGRMANGDRPQQRPAALVWS